MTYRVVVAGSVKAVKRDFEEAKRVAQIEALGSGKMVGIEAAEAGNKWTEVELVSSNGSEISVSEYHNLPDTMFGCLRHEPSAEQPANQFRNPLGFDRASPGGKPRAFG